MPKTQPGRRKSAVASIDYVTYRIRRACCPSEVAVLMLRLAVRAACLASSWYGPWESLQALQELNKVNAWTALLNALGALLGRLGPNLGKQYNAVNIVSDVLHVSQASLSSSSCGLRSNMSGPACACRQRGEGCLCRSFTA